MFGKNEVRAYFLLPRSPLLPGQPSNHRGQTLKLGPSSSCPLGSKSQPGCGLQGLDLGWAVWVRAFPLAFAFLFFTLQSHYPPPDSRLEGLWLSLQVG